MGEIKNSVDQAKAWYKSKTIIGVLITAIATIVKLFLPDVDLEGAVDEVLNNSDDLVGSADQIYATVVQFIGLAVALWGRIKAKLGIKSIV